VDKYLNSTILLLHFDATCGGELNIQKRGREHDFYTWFNCWDLGRTNSPTSARRGDSHGYIRIWATPPRRLVF